ncbi:hypothetical protein B0H12DRAFT_1322527 [Mycena haematopus]|nr:hypothetical protein B0H12DRAFT_1322527 [Mycena haematopus]
MSDHAQALQDATGLDYATFVSHNGISRYVYLAGLVILVYDHLLTLGAEVKYVWLTKLRPSTCWFLALRYIGLVGNITMATWHFADLSHELDLTALLQSCIKLQWAWTFFIVLLETLIEVTLVLRVFAMYGLNKWILGVLLSATGFIFASGLVAIVNYGKDPGRHDLVAAFNGCATILPHSAAVLTAAVWEATLMCDVLVFVLTVRKALAQRSSILYSGSLIQTMVNDGSMYFGVIILSNLANVLSFYVSIHEFSQLQRRYCHSNFFLQFGDVLLAGLLSWFTTSLSLTLLSRLMLNLHDAGSVRIHTIDQSPTDHELVLFTVPIGRMGVDVKE